MGIKRSGTSNVPVQYVMQCTPIPDTLACHHNFQKSFITVTPLISDQLSARFCNDLLMSQSSLTLFFFFNFFSVLFGHRLSLCGVTGESLVGAVGIFGCRLSGSPELLMWEIKCPFTGFLKIFPALGYVKGRLSRYVTLLCICEARCRRAKRGGFAFLHRQIYQYFKTTEKTSKKPRRLITSSLKLWCKTKQKEVKSGEI